MPVILSLDSHQILHLQFRVSCKLAHPLHHICAIRTHCSQNANLTFLPSYLPFKPLSSSSLENQKPSLSSPHPHSVRIHTSCYKVPYGSLVNTLAETFSHLFPSGCVAPFRGRWEGDGNRCLLTADQKLTVDQREKDYHRSVLLGEPVSFTELWSKLQRSVGTRVLWGPDRVFWRQQWRANTTCVQMFQSDVSVLHDPAVKRILALQSPAIQN